jgi:MOSC domain-containing protein YiiM
MAVHHDPIDHHRFWRDTIGEHALLDDRGAFGSNLSTTGLIETDVKLGDRFKLGTALLEVSQVLAYRWLLRLLGCSVCCGRDFWTAQ